MVAAPARPVVARFVLDDSLLRMADTVAPMAWANIELASYDRLAHPCTLGP
jgi:hypothetical protein